MVKPLLSEYCNTFFNTFQPRNTQPCARSGCNQVASSAGDGQTFGGCSRGVCLPLDFSFIDGILFGILDVSNKEQSWEGRKAAQGLYRQKTSLVKETK